MSWLQGTVLAINLCLFGAISRIGLTRPRVPRERPLRFVRPLRWASAAVTVGVLVELVLLEDVKAVGAQTDLLVVAMSVSMALIAVSVALALLREKSPDRGTSQPSTIRRPMRGGRI